MRRAEAGIACLRDCRDISWISLSPLAGGTVASGYDMRVGDAERDAAANELREHFASGRLTQDELNERLDQTFAAKTRGDLSALFTDLPSAGWRDAAGIGRGVE